MFMPGLAEIKMLYEQLSSNRMFNNRGATRSVTGSKKSTSLQGDRFMQQINHFSVLQIVRFGIGIKQL